MNTDWDYQVVEILNLPVGACFMLGTDTQDIYMKGVVDEAGTKFQCDHFMETDSTIYLPLQTKVYIDAN